jgi:hypothetical protein
VVASVGFAFADFWRRFAGSKELLGFAWWIF